MRVRFFWGVWGGEIGCGVCSACSRMKVGYEVHGLDLRV